jgi:hypothetical protein
VKKSDIDLATTLRREELWKRAAQMVEPSGSAENIPAELQADPDYIAMRAERKEILKSDLLRAHRCARWW